MLNQIIIILTSNKNIMDKPYVVGIDIGGQSAKIGIVDTRGTVLSQTAIKSNDTNSHVEFIDNLCTAVL